MCTAEKQRIRKKKITSKISDEKRIQNIQRLKNLKEKLLTLEKEDEKSSNLTELIKETKSEEQTKNQENNIELVDEDNLKDIDVELSNLEAELTQELKNEDFELFKSNEKAIIDPIGDIVKISKQKQVSELSKADLSEVDAELEKLEQEIEGELEKSAIIVSLFDKLCEEHEWIKEPQYGFMYSIPNKKNKKDFESWQDDWGKVLFDYARIASNHIIYSKKLLSEKPWADFKDRSNAIQVISESLVKKKIGNWLDKKKEKLRIYWLSLEAWADSIVDWAQKIAFTEVILIRDIKEAEEDFSTLPEEDIVRIFNIISKNGKGEKHKLKNGQIAITINF